MLVVDISVNCVALPTQTLVLPKSATGLGFTVIVKLIALLHPVVFTPVIVYVVVVVGFAITLAPVVALKPVDGNQL